MAVSLRKVARGNADIYLPDATINAREKEKKKREKRGEVISIKYRMINHQWLNGSNVRSRASSVPANIAVG